MTKVLLRFGMILVAMCLMLAFGTRMAGYFLPSHQLAFFAHYQNSIEQYIVFMDVGRSLQFDIPIDEDRVSIASELVGFAREGDQLSVIDLAQVRDTFLIPEVENVLGWFEVQWSPDGSLLALVALEEGNTDGRDRKIYLSDGVNVYNLTPERSFRDIESLTWSPDNTHLTFIASEERSPLGVFSLNINSGEIVKLTPDDVYVWHFDWSPDGTAIAMSAQRASFRRHIYVMNADGSDLRNLTQGISDDNSSPVWSPDATKIAFISNATTDYDLFIMDVITGHIRRITYHDNTYGFISWSADGEYIVFQTSFRAFDDQIYVIRADGSDEHKLTQDASIGRYPVWLP
jgi:Tol biopolymer transport system component